MAKPEQFPETIVSSSMRIEGELKSNGNIKIDGIISGKIHTAQDVLIGPNAQIDADIIAQSAVIAGVVKGNVTVKNSLLIVETGKVIGNLSCTTLGINKGAYFAGNCRMQEAKSVPEAESEE